MDLLFVTLLWYDIAFAWALLVMFVVCTFKGQGQWNMAWFSRHVWKILVPFSARIQIFM